MSIEIIQTCDGCHEVRQLKVGVNETSITIKDFARDEGWREMKPNKHLCADCINKALHDPMGE